MEQMYESEEEASSPAPPLGSQVMANRQPHVPVREALRVVMTQMAEKYTKRRAEECRDNDCWPEIGFSGIAWMLREL